MNILRCRMSRYLSPYEIQQLGRRFYVAPAEADETRKAHFESKYAEKIAAAQAKAKTVGTISKDGMNDSVGSTSPAPTPSLNPTSTLSSITPTASTPKTTDQKSESPIKPLSSILKPAAYETSPQTLSQLWNAHHAQASNPNLLSAVIPLDTYLEMEKMGKRYKEFVVPLKQGEGVEMHFLQWGFFPHPETTPADVPPLSTVLFTPLGAYRAQGSFAQPHLILTHYTSLAKSHNLVLMRGEITSSASGTSSLLSSTDALRLVLQLQQFYFAEGKDTDQDEKKKLVKEFHERPQEFDIERLIALGREQEV